MDHTIIHFEIPVNDVEKAKKFYSDVFGWKIEKVPNMEYYTITTVPVDEKGNLLRPGVNGGLYRRDQPMQQPVNYVWVESVEEYSKKIEAVGGKVVVPKMEIQGMGWFALGQDPEGNTFGVFEVKPM
jgi:uncharacterized protein